MILYALRHGREEQFARKQAIFRKSLFSRFSVAFIACGILVDLGRALADALLPPPSIFLEYTTVYILALAVNLSTFAIVVVAWRTLHAAMESGLLRDLLLAGESPREILAPLASDLIALWFLGNLLISTVASLFDVKGAWATNLLALAGLLFALAYTATAVPLLLMMTARRIAPSVQCVLVVAVDVLQITFIFVWSDWAAPMLQFHFNNLAQHPGVAYFISAPTSSLMPFGFGLYAGFLTGLILLVPIWMLLGPIARWLAERAVMRAVVRD